MLERSESESEKILVLKSMGNSGAKELIMPIKSVIDEKSQPLVVRTQAVFALRKIAKSFQKLVRTTHYIQYTITRLFARDCSVQFGADETRNDRSSWLPKGATDK